jgi:TrmH family RNA methyltransferase
VTGRFSGTDHISSAANPLVKLVRQIATRRRARHREGLYLIEGERALQTAIENQATFHTLLIDTERRDHLDPALVHLLEQTNARIVTIDAALFQSVSDAETPQPVIAVARIPEQRLPEQATAIVALDAVRDPGNLGTIIRTATAAGVDGIALLPGCVDPYNPKTVRASAGAITAIPVASVADIAMLKHQCFRDPDSVLAVAADAGGDMDYRQVDWTSPLILVAGSEAHGLREATREAVGTTVRIPMHPGVESLNVSTATAILLYRMMDVRTPVGP